MSDTQDPRRSRLTRPTGHRAVTAVLAIVGMNASFMMTIVLPIQARLPELLDAGKDDTGWVVTVTLLVAAIVTPIAGRLGDLFGKRRVLLALLAVLVLGSVIAGLSHSLAGVIVGRGLQGAAMGSVPLGISILRDVLPPARLGPAVAFVSATLGIGGALGLPLAALSAQLLDWHVIFWLSAVLGVLCFVLVATVVPVSVLRSLGRFDAFGAIGLAVGLAGVLLAVTKGAAWGWTSPATLACGIGGAAVLAVWAVVELRIASPLVDLRVAVRPTVLFTNLSSIALGFALFAHNVAVPQILELPVDTGVGLGQTLLTASLVMMPSGIIMMIGSPITGRIADRVGGRNLLAAGALFTALSFVWLLFFSSEVWHFLVAVVIVGVGIALAFAVMPMLIMSAVPATETAAANGLNALMRSLGTTTAAAVVGTILATTSTEVGDTVVPSATGFTATWAVALGAGVLAAALAMLIPRRPRDYPEREAMPPTGSIPTIDWADGRRPRVDPPRAAD